MRLRFLKSALVTAVCLLVSVSPAYSQVFQTAANNPGSAEYLPLSYPLVFVAGDIREVPITQGGVPTGGVQGDYHIGTDVLSANNPSGGNELWITFPEGETKKLFPLPEHMNVPGLIDTPLGRLANSSVVEPNLSEDGTKVYFSFFHDADDTLWPSNLSKKGADLYVMNLGPMLQNPSLPAASLNVKRLTFREYQSNGNPSQAENLKDAMNPGLADIWPNNWGTIYMHATELRTASGLQLVYVSNEKRLQNSNRAMTSYTNHNFNIMIADINPDGSISNPRQSQYYTTTSALSPNRMRDGFAFSYQATTEDGRHWQAQSIDSAGKWYPLLGYGINPGLIHLGSFCVKESGANPGDYFIGARYYNRNNEAFGTLWSLDLSKQGLNLHDVSEGGVIRPRQVGSQKITVGIPDNDDPAPYVNGQYIGKFTSPRCGRADELFFAYSPTSANGRLADVNGNKHYYRSYIGFRPNFEPFGPLDTPSLQQQTGVIKVIVDSSETHNLIWPLPILNWQQRTGDIFQQAQAPVTSSGADIDPGLPHAEVGTSALYNTDVRPFDCNLGPAGNNPWSPNKAHSNINRENDLLHWNIDGLTYVTDQNDFCADLPPSKVLGVAVNLTSNKIRTGDHKYETDGQNNQPAETKRLLGVYSVLDQIDQSFKARVPSNVPFEFQLIDRDTGLRLNDVRSWHSLKPRERRVDCGGCHNHEPGAGISFEGTHAEASAPLDMTGQTTHIEYDASCTPQVVTSSEVSLAMPEWRADIWPGIQQNCSSCHSSSSGNPSAKEIFSFSDEQTAYDQLVDRNFASFRAGGLASPAYWAARGMRTDGRDNSLGKYQPNVSQGSWGFRYSSVHDDLPGLCDGTDQDKANWVYKLGLWIDSHTPRDIEPGLLDYQFDRFHPSADIAFSDNNCSGQSLRVGFWDETGSVSSVRVEKNGNLLAEYSAADNGARLIPIPGAVAADSFSVLVEDFAGNRQKYEKSFAELLVDCTETVQIPNPSPSPSPSPTPSPSPSPSLSSSPSASASPSASSNPDSSGAPKSSPVPSPSETPKPSASPEPSPDVSPSVEPSVSPSPAESPDASPSPSVSSEPEQSPSPNSMSFSASPKRVKLSKSVTLQLELSNQVDSDFRLRCAASLNADGSLASDTIFQRSADWASFKTELGKAEFAIRIPPKKRLIGKEFFCAAENLESAAFSPTDSFSVTANKRLKKSRGKYLKLRRRARVLAKTCNRQLQRSVNLTSAGVEVLRETLIPCQRADSMSSELLAGKSLR